MNVKIRKRIFRTVVMVLSAPFILFAVLSVLIYIPPVQEFAVRTVSGYLAEFTGMNVTVSAVRLKFPIDLSLRGVDIRKKGEQVLGVGRIDVSVELPPLFSSRVEVDEIEIRDGHVNTLDLIDACIIKGRIGRLFVDSHGVQLSEERAFVNNLLLSDSDLDIAMQDSVPPDTATSSEPLNWAIEVANLDISNVGLGLHLAPSSDSLSLKTYLGHIGAAGVIDLGREAYSLTSLEIDGSSFALNRGASAPLKGFDPDHIEITDFNTRMDSLSFSSLTMDAGLRILSLSCKERSGLAVVEAYGGVSADSSGVRSVGLRLSTADSDLSLRGKADYSAFVPGGDGRFETAIEGEIGRNDIFAFMGEVPEDLVRAYPLVPLVFGINASGNIDTLAVEHVDLRMADHFTLRADANMTALLDSLERELRADAVFRCADMSFISKFPAAEGITIPRGTLFDVDAYMRGDVMRADAKLASGRSMVMLTANYNSSAEAYMAEVDVRDLLLNDFMAMTDTCLFSGSFSAKGRGFDAYSPSFRLSAGMLLDKARIGAIDAGGISLDAKVGGRKADVALKCNNALVQADMHADASYSRKHIDVKALLDMPNADLQGLGFSPTRFDVSTKGAFGFSSDMVKNYRFEADAERLNITLEGDSIFDYSLSALAETSADTTYVSLKSGDMQFSFASPSDVDGLASGFGKVASEAARRFNEKVRLDINELKNYLPYSRTRLTAGTDNLIHMMMARSGMSFSELRANIFTSPKEGVATTAYLNTFRKDSIEIDTLLFLVRQDSADVRFRAGARCKDKRLYPGFEAYVRGSIGRINSDVKLEFFNNKHEQGLDLGVRLEMVDSTAQFSLFPEQPIIGFKKFNIEGANRIDLERNGQINADLVLNEPGGCRFELSGSPADTLKQDLSLAIERLDIAQLLTVLPFMPQMQGKLNLKANYIEDSDNYMVKGNAGIDSFAYEHVPVGNIGGDFAYEPLEGGAHSLMVALSHNSRRIAYLGGRYTDADGGVLDAGMSLERFPLSIASAFVPDQMVALHGYLNGNMKVAGRGDDISIDGSIDPDSARITSDIYALNISLDETPIAVTKNKLEFNKYKIFWAGEKPLTLDGFVDFADASGMKMSLDIVGSGIEMINAPRTQKSLLFGKVYSDIYAHVEGTADNVNVRGIVSVLSNTDVTYIMKDTPLSVDDRLNDIVTFVDFNAPPQAADDEEKVSFMGIDMRMQLEVRDGARFKCELSADRQSYINFEGGGSLVFSSTPEGVMSLQGRYTVNDGEMKYSLPVIPLKTFSLRSGSYVEFRGDPMNPMLNIAAVERTKASVSDENGGSRSVVFDVGLKVTNTLENMGLEFTIEAPEDMSVQNELAAMSKEEKNKVAVALLATGMYLSENNSTGFSASNALNNFLQSEINNIAGQALNTAVDINVGMDQTTLEGGGKRTDYTFKFSKRFFSNRLSVNIGGKVSSEADGYTNSNESGAYIDDVSLEWRLDAGGTRYIRLFHQKNYDDLLEGELTENGIGVVLRKKVDKLSELFIFRRKRKDEPEPYGASATKEAEGAKPQKEENGEVEKTEN